MKNYLREWVKQLFYSVPKFREARNRYIQMEQDRDDVYAGNLLLGGEVEFLKFRIKEMARLHEEVVQRSWKGDALREGLICTSPFQRIEVMATGEVYTCCSAHLKHDFSIGNIYQNSIDEIWNSDNAKKLRYSVTMGKFEYCTHLCRWLHTDLDNINTTINPLRERGANTPVYAEYEECKLEYMPSEISLSCDTSCNLICTSCRNQI